MESDGQSSDEFLTEIRYQFDRDLDLRKNLDSKSTHLITMCSTIVTILVSIGTFLITKIVPKNEIFGISLAILGMGIILATCCIYLLTRSYALKTYRYPMGHEQFFKNGIYDLTMSETFRNTEKQKFNKHIIKEYFECIKSNSEIMVKKAEIIKKAQRLFNMAIFSVGIVVVFILGSFGLGLIKLNF